jgi:hypothetical protein
VTLGTEVPAGMVQHILLRAAFIMQRNSAPRAVESVLCKATPGNRSFNTRSS